MRQSDWLVNKYNLILGYVGYILIGLSAVILLPLVMLFFEKNSVSNIYSFVVPSAISFIAGQGLKTRIRNTSEHSLTLEEGGVVVVLTWVSGLLISSLPFIISGNLNFTQAVFESVSGWTTTGLSVVDVESIDRIFLLWRSIMQFLGGAGFAVIMLAAVIGPPGAGLYNAEGRSDLLLPNVMQSARMIMIIYSGYVIGGIILYVLAGMSFFDAVNHSMAALSTGGFSTKTDSIGFWRNPTIELITLALMLLGTTNFYLHYMLLKGRIRDFFKSSENIMLYSAIAVSTPIVFFFTLSSLGFGLWERVRAAVFQTVTAITTTGFSTVSFDNWNDAGVLVIIVLMIIGGGTCSTAGGLKLLRVYTIIKSVYWDIRSYLLPRNVVPNNYIRKGDEKVYIDDGYIKGVYNFTALYVIVFVLGVLIMLLNGYDLRSSVFEYASSIGTVGLSVGVTSPDAPPVVLWAQTIGMALGRLEFMVVFYGIAKVIGDIKHLRRH